MSLISHFSPTVWCDFEIDMCDWQQDTAHDVFDWDWKRGDEVHPAGTQPLIDKTFGTATGI